LKYLWSPWRMTYMKNFIHDEGCIFCQALQLSDGVENLIVYRGKFAFVILNRYPYTSGHLMVLPYSHISSIEELDRITRGEIMELTNQALGVLTEIYQPQGFNIGMNIGKAAGAGISEHLHMHVVPRWKGDTNFMTSLAETRVLPENLSETYARVKAAWRNKD